MVHRGKKGLLNRLHSLNVRNRPNRLMYRSRLNPPSQHRRSLSRRKNRVNALIRKRRLRRNKGLNHSHPRLHLRFVNHRRRHVLVQLPRFRPRRQHLRNRVNHG